MAVEEVAAAFAARVLAVNVYVIEAHPCDEWALPENVEVGIDALAQPTSRDARIAACAEFVRRFTPSLLTVADDVTNAVELAYEARPERLYVLDPADARGVAVVFRSGPGPFQYSVPGLRAFLEARFAA